MEQLAAASAAEKNCSYPVSEPTMADLHELLNFVTKFYYVCCSGKNARMVLNCEAGQASVNFHLNFPHHPANVRHHGHQPPQRKAGPSRLRRRERRSQARAEAAVAKAATTAEQAGNISKDPKASETSTAEEAVPVPPLPPCLPGDLVSPTAQQHPRADEHEHEQHSNQHQGQVLHQPIHPPEEVNSEVVHDTDTKVNSNSVTSSDPASSSDDVKADLEKLLNKVFDRKISEIRTKKFP